VSVHALSANGKESWKMIQGPRKIPDRHQNLTDSSLGRAPALHEILSKSVYNFLKYFAHRRTDRYTELDENSLLGRRKYYC